MEGRTSGVLRAPPSTPVQSPQRASASAVTFGGVLLVGRLEVHLPGEGECEIPESLKVTCSKEATLLFQEEKECEPNQEGGVEVSNDPTAGGQLGFLIPPPGRCQPPGAA